MYFSIGNEPKKHIFNLIPETGKLFNGISFNNDSLVTLIFLSGNEIKKNAISYTENEITQIRKEFCNYFKTNQAPTNQEKTLYLLSYCSQANSMDFINHSESHALEYLRRPLVVQKIADQILEVLQKRKQGAKTITLVLEGLSTRDLCPSCYYNFNICQFASNVGLNLGFWGEIKAKLKKDFSGTINTRCIISSIVPHEDSAKLYQISHPTETNYIKLFRKTPKVDIRSLSNEISQKLQVQDKTYQQWKITSSLKDSRTSSKEEEKDYDDDDIGGFGLFDEK